MAQCPRCKGDMPLLSKICPTCGYTIEDSASASTPTEYMAALEKLLRDFRAVEAPSFGSSLKKFLSVVALLLTIYFFVMSFMTKAFIFKLLCNISIILLFISLIVFIVKKVKSKKVNNANLKSEFEYLLRSARQEYGKNVEMSRFLDNVTKEMVAIDDEHIAKRRSIYRTWIILLVAFVIIFAGSTTITSYVNKKALELAQYGEFQPQIDNFVLSDANSEFWGEVERLKLVVDMLSAGDVEHAQLFVNEFCSKRSGDYDCAEAVVLYLTKMDSITAANEFVENLELQYSSDKQKLQGIIEEYVEQ